MAQIKKKKNPAKHTGCYKQLEFLHCIFGHLSPSGREQRLAWRQWDGKDLMNGGSQAVDRRLGGHQGMEEANLRHK